MPLTLATVVQEYCLGRPLDYPQAGRLPIQPRIHKLAAEQLRRCPRRLCGRSGSESGTRERQCQRQQQHQHQRQRRRQWRRLRHWDRRAPAGRRLDGPQRRRPVRSRNRLGRPRAAGGTGAVRHYSQALLPPGCPRITAAAVRKTSTGARPEGTARPCGGSAHCVLSGHVVRGGLRVGGR